VVCFPKAFSINDSRFTINDPGAGFQVGRAKVPPPQGRPWITFTL